jgi:hypothetical protein
VLLWALLYCSLSRKGHLPPTYPPYSSTKAPYTLYVLIYSR